MRHRISFDTMEAEEVYEIMTEGYEKAGYYLVEIYTKHKDGHGIMLDMDDMNIRGEQIVIGIEKVCNGDIKDFVEKVFTRNPFFVQALNAEHIRHKAVERGASFTETR